MTAGTTRLRPTRRRLLHAAVAAPALVSARSLAAETPPGADGSPAGQRENATVYRFRIGDIRATVLSDGQIGFPAWPAYAPDATEAEVAEALRRHRLDTGTYTLDLNALLIETRGARILLDTGWAGFAPDLGRLAPGLATVGLAPGDIDLVVLSHLHPDHLGGLFDPEGGPAFPRADVVVAADELAQWRDGPDFGAMAVGEDMKPLFAAASASVLRLGPRLRTAGPGEELAPGLALLPLPGHTRGHSGLSIASGGERLLAVADTFHDQAFDLDRPGWRTAFDHDPARAEATRRALLARASAEGTRLLAYHMPFPGIGRVAAADRGYRWQAERWRIGG